MRIPAQVGGSQARGICSAHAAVLQPKLEMTLPGHLPFFLQSDMFMERAIEISVGSLAPAIDQFSIIFTVQHNSKNLTQLTDCGKSKNSLYCLHE